MNTDRMYCCPMNAARAVLTFLLGTSMSAAGGDLGEFGGRTEAELLQMKPTMFKYEEYPPVTQEGIRMWQWWRAMQNVDRMDFEWKFPIEFFGRVVDQNAHPVPAANIDMQWSVIGGTRETSVVSDVDGRFSISGLVGRALTVRVNARGYVGGTDGQKTFEYAEFFDPLFHVPDASNPVVFTLWKSGRSEPMYKSLSTVALQVDGTPVWVDCRSGTVSPTGEVCFSVARHGDLNLRQSGYKIVVTVPAGGGLAWSQGGDEKFMFEAPPVGYGTTLTVDQEASRGPNDVSFRVGQHLNFYLRTPDGKYAAVQASVYQYMGPSAGLDLLIFFNPSGSRHLEFDYKQQIDGR